MESFEKMSGRLQLKTKIQWLSQISPEARVNTEGTVYRLVARDDGMVWTKVK